MGQCEMRGQIIDSLFAEMRKQEDIFFLTADMGINLVERFGVEYPSRFSNVGIAEQNLIGVASGLCNAGYRPFTYTISNFLIHRCFEQLRNDVSLHKYPVVMLGASAGFDNAPLGPTHHIIDDWGVLRNLPNIDIYAPTTIAYAGNIISKLLDSDTAAYVRISKGGSDFSSSLEDVVHIRGNSNKLLFVSYGGVAGQVIDLQKKVGDVSLLLFNRILPMDEDYVANILAEYDNICIVEDHIAGTGLYSIFLNLLQERKIQKNVISRAPAMGFTIDVGQSPDYFYRKYGMDSDSLAELV
jgi:transketolase